LEYYKNLGQLLKAYRVKMGLSQQRLADEMQVELKTYQRWERNLHPAKKENLLVISRTTGIPMNALISLNFGQHLYYSIIRRRYALGRLETTTPVYNLLLNDEGSPVDEGETIYFHSLDNKDYLKYIKEYDDLVYPSEKSFTIDILQSAARILPELNFIALDQWQLPVGHITCIPLSTDFYLTLKGLKSVERKARIHNLVDITREKKGVYYFWSTHGASSFVYHNILFKSAQHWPQFKEDHQDLLVANLSVSRDGYSVCSKLGMQIVAQNFIQHELFDTEIVPTLFEIPLGELMFNLSKNNPFRSS
jgi:transcriptional regulator with XRE-family HTH domain